MNCARPLRSNRSFNVPICKANRFKNSFIMCNSSDPNASKVNSFYIVNSFLFSIIVFHRNNILLNCKIFVFVKSNVIQPIAANFRLLINHLLTYLHEIKRTQLGWTYPEACSRLDVPTRPDVPRRLFAIVKPLRKSAGMPKGDQKPKF